MTYAWDIGWQVGSEPVVSPFTEIRFGIGDKEGWHSASWRLWHSGSGRDVYLSSRDIGEALKLSFHDGLWRVAWTKETRRLLRKVRFNVFWILGDESGDLTNLPEDRLIAEWTPESTGQLGPHRHVFGVTLGRFSLGWLPPDVHPVLEARRRKGIKGVEWFPIPPVSTVWRFALFITESGNYWLPTNPMSLVGHINLADGSHAWLAILPHPEPRNLADILKQHVDEMPEQISVQVADGERVLHGGQRIFPPSGIDIGSVLDIAINANLPEGADPPPEGAVLLQ